MLPQVEDRFFAPCRLAGIHEQSVGWRSMSSEYVRIDKETVNLSGSAFSSIMTSVLDKGCRFRFTAPGLSMTPFIRDCDRVTVEPLTKPVRLGDVVAFSNPHTEKLTVHRVVKVSENGYLIKGDNCLGFDGLVPPEKMIGRVVHVACRGRGVRIGLGKEKILIAFLSRQGWLHVVVRIMGFFSRLFKPILRQH